MVTAHWEGAGGGFPHRCDFLVCCSLFNGYIRSKEWRRALFTYMRGGRGGFFLVGVSIGVLFYSLVTYPNRGGKRALAKLWAVFGAFCYWGSSRTYRRFLSFYLDSRWGVAIRHFWFSFLVIPVRVMLHSFSVL